MSKAILTFVIVLSFSVAAPLAAYAQDEDGGAVLIVNQPSPGGTLIYSTAPTGGGTLFTGGGGGSISGGLTGDIVILLPSDFGAASPWTVPQGSTVTFDLKLYGGGVADVNSFSIDIGAVPDLVLTSITTLLPSGYGLFL